MISRTLIRLIDQAIVPAILLLSVRLVSIVMLSYLYGIEFGIGKTGFVFPSKADYVFINSLSTFFMVAVLAIGLFYILLKAFIFHDTHITPDLTAKLFHFRLSTFIQNSFELYSQGAVWLSYLYLTMAVTGILAYFELVYAWVFFVSLALSLISTVVLIFDVENELQIKKQENEYLEDDTPMNIYTKDFKDEL